VQVSLPLRIYVQDSLMPVQNKPAPPQVYFRLAHSLHRRFSYIPVQIVQNMPGQNHVSVPLPISDHFPEYKHRTAPLLSHPVSVSFPVRLAVSLL